MAFKIERHLVDHNYTLGRKSAISEITIHHAAGRGPLSIMLADFSDPKRKGSAHYGIRDSEVYQFVDESNTAWANSNQAANNRAITIEVVNSSMAPDYAISITSYETLINLVYDIAKRNRLLPLVKGTSLTWHSLYAKTLCPGPWLLEHMDDLANRVNLFASTADILGDLIDPRTKAVFKFSVIYRVRNIFNDPDSQKGAFNDVNRAIELCDTLNQKLRNPHDGTEQYAVYTVDGDEIYPKGNHYVQKS